MDASCHCPKWGLHPNLLLTTGKCNTGDFPRHLQLHAQKGPHSAAQDPFRNEDLCPAGGTAQASAVGFSGTASAEGSHLAQGHIPFPEHVASSKTDPYQGIESHPRTTTQDKSGGPSGPQSSCDQLRLRWEPGPSGQPRLLPFPPSLLPQPPPKPPLCPSEPWRTKQSNSSSPRLIFPLGSSTATVGPARWSQGLRHLSASRALHPSAPSPTFYWDQPGASICTSRYAGPCCSRRDCHTQ